MMWPGAEPAKDQFNETYFVIAKDIVSKSVDIIIMQWLPLCIAS